MFVGFPGREELKGAVKEIGGPAGSARAQAFVTALKDTGVLVKEVGVLAQTLKDAIAARDAGKLQICVRSGLVILVEKAPGKVESFYTSCNSVGCKGSLPQKLKTLLDELKASAPALAAPDA